MTPEERLRYSIQGIVNRIDRRIEALERIVSRVRPATDSERDDQRRRVER